MNSAPEDGEKRVYTDSAAIALARDLVARSHSADDTSVQLMPLMHLGLVGSPSNPKNINPMNSLL
ncbi:MAG: hypothetical protein JWN70_6927 [Planctomycetaceae bacterium]|nr:hypothetical protein [Planctomycetaceae bacterium]